MSPFAVLNPFAPGLGLGLGSGLGLGLGLSVTTVARIGGVDYGHLGVLPITTVARIGDRHEARVMRSGVCVRGGNENAAFMCYG